MKSSNFEIQTCRTSFKCPMCGTLVKPGHNYVEQDGIRTCLCVLPVRRLIPLATIKQMEETIHNLKFANLKLRLQLEVIA